MFQTVSSFVELLRFRFVGQTNAACWPRAFSPDFAEVIRVLGPGEGVEPLDEDRLKGLSLSAGGQEAVRVMLSDLALLREADRDPVLNLIHAYPRDESDSPIATDVMSWHVDSAPFESDTWLCTYEGAPSEALHPGDAVRKIDDPKLRAQLLEHYGGTDDEAFLEWLIENHYDLHYTPREGVVPYSCGKHNLWRMTCEFPENRVNLFSSPVSHPRSAVAPAPPCVHRAPLTQAPRLLLIS